MCSQRANLVVTQPATHPECVNTIALTGTTRNTHRLGPVGAVREPPTTAIGLGKNSATLTLPHPSRRHTRYTYTNRVTPDSLLEWQGPVTETVAAALLQRLPVLPR